MPSVKSIELTPVSIEGVVRQSVAIGNARDDGLAGEEATVSTADLSSEFRANVDASCPALCGG